MKSRDIGQEILSGIEEIKVWQESEKRLKVTYLTLPTVGDVAKNRHKLGKALEALFEVFQAVKYYLIYKRI